MSANSPASSSTIAYRSPASSPSKYKAGGDVWTSHYPDLSGGQAAAYMHDDGRYATFREPSPPPPPLFGSSPSRKTPTRREGARGDVESSSTNMFSVSRANASDFSPPYQPFTPSSPKGKERERATENDHLMPRRPHVVNGRCTAVRRWCLAFQRVKSARRLHPKAEGLSHWIQVAGQLSEACDGHAQGQAWHSSLIVERVGPRLLKTKSGRLYSLEGPCDRTTMEQKKGFPAYVVDRFSTEFPDDWTDLLVAEARRRGHIAPPRRNRNRGKLLRRQSDEQVRPVNAQEDVIVQDPGSSSSEESEDEYHPASRSTKKSGAPPAKRRTSPIRARSPAAVTAVAKKPLPREILALSKTKLGRLVAVDNAIMDGIEEGRAERRASKRQSLPARLIVDDPLTPQSQIGIRSALTPRTSTRKRSAARKWWEVQEAAAAAAAATTTSYEAASSKDAPRTQRKVRQLRAGQYLTSDVSGVFSDSADNYVAAASTEHDADRTSCVVLPTSQHYDDTEASQDAAPTSSPLRMKQRKRLAARTPTDRGKRVKVASDCDASHSSVEAQSRAESTAPQRSKFYSIFKAVARSDDVDEVQEKSDSAGTAPSSPASSDVLDDSLHNADVETGITTMSDDEADDDAAKAEGHKEIDDVAMIVTAQKSDESAPLLAEMSEQISQMSIDHDEHTTKAIGAIMHLGDSADEDLREYLVLSSSSIDVPLIKGENDKNVAGAVVVTPRIVYDLSLSQDKDAMQGEEDEEDEDESVYSDDDDRLYAMTDEQYYCFSD